PPLRGATHEKRRGESPGCLQQLFQLFDRFGVLWTDWLVPAAGICSLQSTSHRVRNRQRSATVVGFTHEIPLRTGCAVTAKAVPAKSIDDVGGTAFSNFRSILRHVELEELPIMRFSVEALVVLDHGLARNQLKQSSRWIHPTRRRIGGGQRRV